MLQHYFTFALTVFIGLFAVMNPLTKAPVFISLTNGATKEKKDRVAKKAGITAFLILVAFVLLGNYIFKFFGLTIPAFKIAGGIIVFFVGFEMLQSKRSSITNPAQVNFDESISISPLAIPIMSGPGTIITSMNYVTNENWIEILIVIIISALICYLNYLAYYWSSFLMNFLGENIMTAIHKIMGLILAILGTNMVLDGWQVFSRIGLNTSL